MARAIYDLGSPDRFVAGAVGEPGKRTFYLQARKGTRLVTVALEKAQVAALAARVVALLAAVRRAERQLGMPGREAGSASRGSTTAAPGSAAQPEGLSAAGSSESIPPDPAGELEQPLDERFRVGTMALGWDAEDRVLVLEARAQTEEEDDPAEFPDDEEEGPDLVRVRLEATTAEAFAQDALRVVASGRPPCPVCGEPLDPQGHLCARRNGYVH
jgi:hypothetical protein